MVVCVLMIDEKSIYNHINFSNSNGIASDILFRIIIIVYNMKKWEILTRKIFKYFINIYFPLTKL